MVARNGSVRIASVALVLLVAGALGVTRGALAAVRRAAGPPVVMAVIIRILGPTAASVIAELDPNGAATSVDVRFGPTTAYGEETAPHVVAGGTTPVSVSTRLSGLRPGTTYHVELVALSGGGRAVSHDVTFATPPGTLSARPAPSGTLPPPAGSADRLALLPLAPIRGFSSLSSISCAGPDFCLAVGVSGLSEAAIRPLVEEWGGRAFHILASPEPPGAHLLGVSCPTVDFCLAVGAAGSDTYSERWNGRGWRVEPTPSPRITGTDLLQSVSCATTSDCWAVGAENAGTADVEVLVEHWNGAAWSSVGVPRPPAAAFYTIDCTGPTSCWAGGIKDTSHGVGEPFVEHGNGRTWMLSPLPLRTGQLFSLSCSGAASCFAVGTTGRGTDFALRLSGPAWQQSPLPPLAGVDAVACVAASDCFAAGGFSTHWNGRSWSLGGATVAEPGVPSPDLQALACLVPRECIGVGTAGLGVTGERAVADEIRT